MIFSSSIGNYKLTPTTLGKGSFSKVVLANHIILNKQVALKVVTLRKIKDPYVSKNLKREPAIMEKLNHPHQCFLGRGRPCRQLLLMPGR